MRATWVKHVGMDGWMENVHACMHTPNAMNGTWVKHVGMDGWMENGHACIHIHEWHQDEARR
jgi:hypothetical protein